MLRSLPLFLLAPAAAAGDGTIPITGPTWSFEPDQAGAALSFLRAAGDVNGDGYSDVIASAPLFDAAQVDAGRAWLFLGGAGGASSTSAWSSSGPDNAGANFGSWISTAGDVDGDGYDDVLVVAQRFDQPEVDEGAVWLYRGGASGLSATPSWSFEGNQQGLELASASYAGDLNHDGYDDVVVGAVNPGRTGRVFLFYGRPTGLPAAPDWTLDGASLALQAGSRFGSSVSTACDVNADGFDDFLVAASHYPTPASAEGGAWLFLGGASLPSTTPSWFASGGELGAAFAASASNLGPAGDVDGDGYADVVVGAGEKGALDAGAVRVYRGSSAGLSLAPWVTLDGTQSQARFGTSAGSAGDVNGDGYADLWIGSPDFVGTGGGFGRVQLFLGAYNTVETPAIAEFVGWSPGATANDAFGRDAATLGDVDGDGYADVGVCAPNRSNGEPLEGRATSFNGCARGLRPQHDWIGSRPVATFFGAALDGGDFDGDGYSDLAVGETGLSRVEVFRGGPTGLGAIPLLLGTTLGASFSRFGAQVGAAGDVNGDGYCDLLVGAPDFNSGEVREGAVFLHLGGPSGLSTSAAWYFESNQAEARLGFSIATGCDFDGDGLADVVVSAYGFTSTASQEGRVYVFRGSRSGPPLVLAATLDGGISNALLGWALASAGDVDADGFGDILVSGGAGLPSLQLLRGSSTGLATVASWTYFGNVYSVEGAGDVNGDGFADIILTNPPRLFFGSPAGPSVAPDWAITTGDPANSIVVAPAGDINADGYADVAIADPNAGFPYWVGHAWIYLGGPGGPGTSAYWEANGLTLGTYAQDSAIGAAMRGVGDVNGDGVGDFALGAPSILIDDYPPCRAYVFLGNKRGGPALRPQARTASSLAPIAPLGLSEAPDAFRIRVQSANPARISSTVAGRRDVRLEWQVARLGQPFTAGPMGHGDFVPGVPVGAPLALEELASGLEPGRALRWRARLANKSPIFPHSTWLSAPVFTTTETMLRTDHDCNANGIGDTTDLASGTSADANGNGVPDECEAPVVVCAGDGTGTACPCGNQGASGHGCAHSSSAAGAVLGASGIPSVGFDTFVLHGTGMPNTSSVLYFQGTALAQNGAGVTFGDGLRCAVGAVVRLGIGTNSGGASSYPGSASDAPISVQGQIPVGGAVTRHYQAWYRDAASFCTSLTFNLSNALSVTWAP